jgi:hypothetical protein
MEPNADAHWHGTRQGRHQAGNSTLLQQLRLGVQSTDKSRQIQVSNYKFEQIRAVYIHICYYYKKKHDKQGQLTILEDMHPSREIHGIFRWIIIPLQSLTLSEAMIMSNPWTQRVSKNVFYFSLWFHFS